MLTEVTARIGGGDFAVTPLEEILHPAPEDNRTEEEIIGHIRGKLREMGGAAMDGRI